MVRKRIMKVLFLILVFATSGQTASQSDEFIAANSLAWDRPIWRGRSVASATMKKIEASDFVLGSCKLPAQLDRQLAEAAREIATATRRGGDILIDGVGGADATPLVAPSRDCPGVILGNADLAIGRAIAALNQFIKYLSENGVRAEQIRIETCTGVVGLGLYQPQERFARMTIRTGTAVSAGRHWKETAYGCKR